MADWQDPKTQAIWLGILFVVILSIVGLFIYFTKLYLQKRIRDQSLISKMKLAHQNRLLEDSLLVQEAERKRIAADLHDEVISKLNIALLQSHANKDTETQLLIKQCMDTARQISHDLSPPLIEFNSLESILEDLLIHFKSHYHIAFYFTDHSSYVPEVRFKLQIIRIIQELLNNVVKHSSATTIRLILRKTDSYLSFIFCDNGKGFLIDSTPSGLGTSNIEMRTQSLQGKHKLTSKKGKGTRHFFLIPISKTTSHE